MLTLTPKQNVAWLDHLEWPELRRHLFYGGARSGKTDVIPTWLCIQVGLPTLTCPADVSTEAL